MHHFAITIALLLCQPFTTASPTSSNIGRRDNSEEYLRYAVFGDSYASGVTWGAGCPFHCNGWRDRDYDYGNPAEIRRCRRIKEAYAVQLEKKGWWAKGKVPYLDWPACSGSKFEQAKEQARTLFAAQEASGNISQLATLQIGGNNARYIDVLDNCIIQLQTNCSYDYGEPFPDPTGLCSKAIEHVTSTIIDPVFAKNITEVFDTILHAEPVKRNQNFRLYVLGYPQFFNDEDWHCDKISWTVWCADKRAKYKLTTALRTSVNEMIRLMNAIIVRAVMDYAKRDPRIVFVSIDEGFDGHRFCEDPGNPTPWQLSGFTGYEKSWLWRLPKFSDFVPPNTKNPGPYSTRTDAPWNWDPFINATTPVDPEMVLKCPSLGNASAPNPWDLEIICSLVVNSHQPIAHHLMNGGDEHEDPDSGGPGGGGFMGRGEVRRSFHPTQEGHAAIARIVGLMVRGTFDL